MKQLTCEMCGSTDLVKDGGVFVCQSCGCKYSIEEARKMMVEGTVSVEGTVKVDNSQLIENYLSMAQSAADSDNESEAESYANKVLELEPTNWRALYIKGNAAGWQSGTRNNRIPEAIDYFSQAITNCNDEEQLAGLKEKIAADVSKLTLAMISLHCNNFAKFPSVENAQSIVSEASNSLLLTMKLIITCGTTPDDFKAQAATLMNACVVQAWKSIWSDYTDDKPIQPQGIATSVDHSRYSHPSRYDWQRFYQKADACMSILETAIALDDDDDEEDIQRYENLIFIAEQTVDSHSVSYIAGSAYTNAKWCKEYSFTTEAKASRRREIAKWKTEKAECAKKTAEKKIEAYWESHPGERDRIQEEIAALEEEIDGITASVDYVSAKEQVANYESSKKDLEKKISECGLFNGKEKKRLRAELEALGKQVEPYQAKLQAFDRDVAAKRRKMSVLRARLVNPTS